MTISNSVDYWTDDICSFRLIEELLVHQSEEDLSPTEVLLYNVDTFLVFIHLFQVDNVRVINLRVNMRITLASNMTSFSRHREYSSP